MWHSFFSVSVGYELRHTPSFGESTDGTTIRNITYKAHHVTMRVPSYAPDVDDNNSSTWTHQTRFVDVHAAIDHTAEQQVSGSHEIAERISDTFSSSPLAERLGETLGVDDWYTKQTFENMDHAKDGQKKNTGSRRNARRRLFDKRSDVKLCETSRPQSLKSFMPMHPSRKRVFWQ